MATVPWFRYTNGLKTTADSARLEYSEKTGVVDLAECLNVDVGDTGDISRRLGYAASEITSECHSLFCEDSICLFVTGDALCLLAEDLSYTELRNVTPNARMSYQQLGNVVYYGNGFEIGLVHSGASWEWAMPANITKLDKTRTYSNPPVGNIVRHYAGRMWIAKGNVIWYSEAFQYGVFNIARNFLNLPSKCLMFAPVSDGVYISTQSRIYFYSGADPNNMTVVPVTNYPAIFGTDLIVDGIAVESGKYSNLLVPMWTATKGVCIGLPGGNVINLTHSKLDYPTSIEGCALYTGKKYIVNLEP